MARKTETIETEVVETEAAETETIPAETETETEVVDLSTFEDAVRQAVEDSDGSTGTVPEAHVAAVRDAYQGLGRAGKLAARAYLKAQLNGFVDTLDIASARAVQVLIKDGAVAAAAPKAERKPREPKDLTPAVIEKIAELTLALFLASSHETEGVVLEDAAAAATERANEAFATAQAIANGTLEADDETPGWVRRAVRASRLGKTKGGGGGGGTRREGPNRSVEVHIREAFADLPVGTFLSAAEIRKFTSAEYGDDSPSAGAILNRVNPKGGEGTNILDFETANQDGKVGLVKIAEY